MHKNNFDFLRLCFAISVVLTHSYHLSSQLDNDWMHSLTNGQFSLSYIGVRGFFIISGYLIFQSLERSKTILMYYKKRILRIFPGLFVALVLTVLLGFIVFDGGISDYIKTKAVWTYLPNNLSLYRLQAYIKGIFDNNPYKAVINGCLWTLPYEFSFYMFLSILFFFKEQFKKIMISIAVIAVLIGRIFFMEKLGAYGRGHVIAGSSILDLGAYFFSGSLLASLKIESFQFNRKLILSILLLLLTVVIVSASFEKLQYLLLPPIIIIFGALSTPYINNISSKLGDLSYGIYIYGFPIQQTLMHYFNFNHTLLTIYSVPLAILFGAMSWHLVEKRVLRLK
jgi:peptidoglycan/LPS O-acetylase OafA/YrhL